MGGKTCKHAHTQSGKRIKPAMLEAAVLKHSLTIHLFVSYRFLGSQNNGALKWWWLDLPSLFFHENPKQSKKIIAREMTITATDALVDLVITGSFAVGREIMVSLLQRNSLYVKYYRGIRYWNMGNPDVKNNTIWTSGRESHGGGDWFSDSGVLHSTLDLSASPHVFSS